MNRLVSTAQDWTERYEALRREALAAPPLLEQSPWGMILLLRHGVAEWMSRWTLAQPAPAKPSTRTSIIASEEGWQNQVAVLLAQMTMPHLQMHHCL
jgi:hypothetical protein